MKRRELLVGASAAAGGTLAASGSAGAQDGETHTVDMTNGLVFDPDELTIAPGDTVVWENVGTVPHSVTAYGDNIPEEAEYFASGGFESEEAARQAYPPEGGIPGGESYQHTFEVEGEYEYFCIPHEQAGMVGSLTVGGDGGGEQAGGEEAPAGGEGGVKSPEEMGVPFQAHFVGLATILGMVVSLVFAFFVLKYGESPHSSSPERK